MKRIIVFFCLMMILILTVSDDVFGSTDTTKSTSGVKALKSELSQILDDDVISKVEMEQLKKNTSKNVIELYLLEKMDKAVEILADEGKNHRLLTLEQQETYRREIIDLEDGCTLIIELSDESIENDNETRGTSGSSTLWKNYGNRYFTASASVSFPLGSVTIKLRNYYVLSSKGIDEDRGKGTLIYDSIGGSYSISNPKITDATARTVGASDVNMECEYTLNFDNIDDIPLKRVYKITSTVGFVDINKSQEKIKVKQSWKLTRLI